MSLFSRAWLVVPTMKFVFCLQPCFPAASPALRRPSGTFCGGQRQTGLANKSTQRRKSMSNALTTVQHDEGDRVRRSTALDVNRQIDRQTEANIMHYLNATPEVIRQRVEELDHEWDVERMLEVNASTLALTGLVLGATVNKKWLILPGIVLPFLLQHGLRGWCPPLPVLRHLGVRTRGEIDREKYALLSSIKDQPAA